MSLLKVAELCCGLGVISYIVQQYLSTQFTVVYACDTSKTAKKFYNANFDSNSTVFEHCDIKNKNVADLPDFDVLCSSGFIYRKSMQDSQMIKIMNIIKDKSPTFIILENDKNFPLHDKGRTLQYLIHELENDYNITYSLLNSSEFSKLPYYRERLYIIGEKKSKSKSNHVNTFMVHTNTNTNTNIHTPISEILLPIEDPEFDNNKLFYSTKTKTSSSSSSPLQKMISQYVVKSIEENVSYQYRRNYITENKNKMIPSFSVFMTSSFVPIIMDSRFNDRIDIIRRLTQRECMYLNGFKKDTFIIPKSLKSAIYLLLGRCASVDIMLNIFTIISAHK